MKDAVNKDDSLFDFVEDEIVIDHQHPIPQPSKFGILGDTASERMRGESLEPELDTIKDFRCGLRIFCGGVRYQLDQVLLCTGEEANMGLI